MALSQGELMRWAQMTAKANGTRTGDENMRFWYAGFVSRIKKETGIDLQRTRSYL